MNLDDVRPGDIVTVKYDGYEYTGPVVGGPDLMFVGLDLRADNPRLKFVSAERPIPTEPGTILTNVTMNDGETYRIAYIDPYGYVHAIDKVGYSIGYSRNDVETYGDVL